MLGVEGAELLLWVAEAGVEVGEVVGLLLVEVGQVLVVLVD